jgi:DNA-directed RNA polymerase subunit beta
MRSVFMFKEQKPLKVKDSFGVQSSMAKRKFFQRRLMVSLPNLIESQINSYQWFLEKGLKELLDEVNPIKDFTGKDLELTLDEYYLD